jgi:hypothetical protein
MTALSGPGRSVSHDLICALMRRTLHEKSDPAAVYDLVVFRMARLSSVECTGGR